MLPESQLPSPNYDVKLSLRRSGFRLMALFAVLIGIVIVISQPQNAMLALSFSAWCLLTSCAALYFEKHAQNIAKVWALVAIPIAPIIVFNNGILPATLIPLIVIFPIVFLSGWWQISAMLIVAGSIFLVPLNGTPYDQGLWLRLTVTNIVMSLLIYRLVSHLEAALVESNNQKIQLDRALALEKQASAAQSQFLATMSHEIRTPLNGILGLTSVLLSNELNENARPKLEKIQQSGSSLNRILNDVLDVSKLNAGKLTIESIPFDLVATVKNGISFYTQLAQDKGISLNVDIDKTVNTDVVGDAVRLLQILNNLVSNAIKFTQRGSVTVSLQRIEASKDSQRIALSVIDTGEGIEEVALSTIFDAFTQANSSISRTHGGTGLGLRIVKSLVESMGGTISVESAHNEGSTFIVSLPFSLAEQQSSSITSQATTMSDTSAPSVKATAVDGLKIKGLAIPSPFVSSDAPSDYKHSILVVDDNEINQIVAKSLLDSMGVNVTLASSGKEAIALLTQHNYDLILMDLQMPEMSGADAAKALRQKEVIAPIIAFTASVMPDEINNALSSGMNDYLTKPVDHNALTTVLRKHLKR
ncbi:ATP-binding protein [Alteromonas sp.]|nr:ATP-binding protein [Alteromonas sp.]